MCDKTFENNCDKIITNLNTQDIVAANSVVKLAIKISKKHPALFLPAFIEDFIVGMPSSKMIAKYKIFDFNNLQSIITLLNLKSRPHKDNNLNGKSKNLQDQELRTRYDFLSKYVNLLYVPLEGLLNHSILQTLVSYAILKHTFIASENLQSCIMDAYHATNMNVPILSNNDRRDSFKRYLADDIYIKISDIISSLHKHGYIAVRDSDVSITPKYENTLEYIYNLLHNETNGIRYSSFQRIVLDEFPLFKLSVPSIHAFENILGMLESKKLLIRKKSFWKYSPNYDQLFTTENYDALMNKISKQAAESRRIKFFGRRIKPMLFLDELKALEYGDIGDEDDQVTRIAGLVLSDSAMLQSPHESMEEFDFVVDLKNYHFRPEQEELMKKLDFKISSNIIHCKVMINEKVTNTTLSNLEDALPATDQGVIFTCMPISEDVLNTIKNNKTVQVVNEDAISDWCSITPVIPCRKNAVAKIRYGDDVGKMVRIKSLNYESGLADVKTIHGNLELLIPIGSMEESLPDVSSLDDFDTVSEKYADFLELLAYSSTGRFAESLNTKIISIHDTFADLREHANADLPDVISEKYFGSNSYNSNSRETKYVQFQNVCAKIKVANSLRFSKCTCGHLLDSGSYETLCPHLVAGLDRVCRGTGDAKTILQNSTKLEAALLRFRFDNARRAVEALSFALGAQNHVLKSYLTMCQS